jgi:hypothetical protein
MKVSKRQLRRIIREFSNRSYDMGLRDAESGQEPDQERYDNDPDYADGYDSYDPYDHLEEAEGSTKKYDDDSALKGGQSKLPDGLQKSIIDKTVEDREEHDEERKEKNEGTDLGNMPDSWRQILGNCLGKETIKEEKNRPLHEQPISGEQAEQMQHDQDRMSFGMAPWAEDLADYIVNHIYDLSTAAGIDLQDPEVLATVGDALDAVKLEFPGS